MALALTGARVFDGDGFHENSAVITRKGHIVGIVPADEGPKDIARVKLKGGILAPAFIDTQVNGGGGVLLNNDPTVDGVRRIAEAHRHFGTMGLLPTIITDRREVMEAAAQAVRKARRAGVRGILGIHIEGPFIDPRRKGAHDPALIRPMTEEDAAWLTQLDCGIVMVTVAPSACPPAMIRALAAKGVMVSLGHAEATAEEARQAFAAGARGVTHLFNAMSQLGHRAPGLVGAALADPDCWCGLIADGHHVDPVALKIALAAKPKDKFMLVTDAMSPAAGGPDRFTLQGREVVARHGRLELADGTLAGANITMDMAVRYCVKTLGVPLADALCMASLNPAAFLGCDDEFGRIAPGYRSCLVHLNDDLESQGVLMEHT
jgi:N-acetylglucosamine-6-phosphate deacetylase